MNNVYMTKGHPEANKGIPSVGDVEHVYTIELQNGKTVIVRMSEAEHNDFQSMLRILINPGSVVRRNDPELEGRIPVQYEVPLEQNITLEVKAFLDNIQVRRHAYSQVDVDRVKARRDPSNLTLQRFIDQTSFKDGR